MEKEVTYIAELDADVDDVVAAEYLFSKGVLKTVVCDPLPKTPAGKDRMQKLTKLGIEIATKLIGKQKYVFVGGALTEVARFITMNHIDMLVMNGGFVGDNLVSKEHQLDKFLGKKEVRTFNFNCDVQATDKVLRSTEKQIGKILLVGKNVCHSQRNTAKDLWNGEEYAKIFKKYNVKEDKCQHDMLACHEGLAYNSLGGVTIPFCSYHVVRPYNTGLQGEYTQWGSKKEEDKATPYRTVVAAMSLI